NISATTPATTSTYTLSLHDALPISTFNNEAGASFAFATDAEIINNGGSPSGGTFVNAGTLSKTGGTGTSSVNGGVAFNQTGTGRSAEHTPELQSRGHLVCSPPLATK